MMNTLRWLAVAPAAILGLCLGVLLTAWLVSGADWLTYHYTYARPWWDGYLRPAAECMGAALTAFLMVTLAVLVAPAKRLLVAGTAFCAGTGIALSILPAKGEYAALGSALVAGLLAVLLTRWLTAGGLVRPLCLNDP